MDKKVLAVLAVVVIVVAAAGIYLATQNDKESNDYNIIGRVNTQGSGIFFNEGTDVSEYYQILEDGEAAPSGWVIVGNVALNPSAWGGKIFADPGLATIQHVQLGQLAEAMNLNFLAYSVGMSLNQNTLYFVPNVSSYALYESQLQVNKFTGGFMWEAQVSVATVDGCAGPLTTNDLFPNHTCCVIGGVGSWMESHQDATIRFLAAYVEAVDSMNAAIRAGAGSEAYENLMSIALQKVSMPDGMSDADKREAIASALNIVTYTYCDDPDAADPLSALRADIADLVEQFGGGNNKSYSDLGFDSAEALADVFVNSSYMASALDPNYTMNKEDKTTINVSVITGDIHQLAIHYGIAMKIFEDYGITVEVKYQTNGPGVYGDLANGTSQFGFIGAPPMTTNCLNNNNISPA